MRRGLPSASLALALCAGISACQATNGMKGAVQSATLTRDSRSGDLYLSLIDELIQADKYYAALAHIDEFERLYGKTPRSAILRGTALLALGDLDRAATAFRAIPVGALSGYASDGLGRVSAAKGNWELASTQFTAAVNQQPTNVQFLSDLGRSLFRVGRIDESIFALRKALELNPADSEAQHTLSAVLAESGREDHGPGFSGGRVRVPANEDGGKTIGQSHDRMEEAQ